MAAIAVLVCLVAVGGILWRRARRFGLIALAAVALIAANGLVPASAAANGARSGTPTLASAQVANTAQTPITSKPCFYQFPDCSSTDSQASFGYASVGDTSSCVYEAKFTWGDGSKAVDQKFNGAADGKQVVHFTHDYKNPRAYTISGNISLVQGSCGGTGPIDDVFTLLHKEKLRLAALGDSYSSGEGAGDYLPGTDAAHGCHRSARAWSLQLDKYATAFSITMPSQNLLACSGALSGDVWKVSFKGQQPQVDVLKRLNPKPTVITLTIGGNDLGFSTVLRECAGTGCAKAIKGVEAEFGVEEKVLEHDYKEVHAADPDATILVVGYPRIFEVSRACFLFSVNNEVDLNVLTGKVDAMIEGAVAKAGLSSVRFVPNLDTLDDHGLCTTKPWLYEITAERAYNDDQQQAHPNALGQVAIAKVVAAYIDSHL